MFLVDTNIWLERMLDQEKSDEVKAFLESVDSDELWITDFSLHSIGVILVRLNQHEKFAGFIEDLFEYGEVKIATLIPTDLIEVLALARTSGLGFDDAYQLFVSQKNNLIFVTLDKDFKNKGFKTHSPLQALRQKKAKN